MVNTLKLKKIYYEIQTQLFKIIPEKWNRICLYASLEDKVDSMELGEMFFYYYPAGILKKKPINVYEVPNKFNIDEDSYMKLVYDLYDIIKLLRKEFEKAKEKLWTNVTISIENRIFQVEYDYEDLHLSKYSNHDRHIIWQYNYLNFPIERFSREDRVMLQSYLEEENVVHKETKKYSERIYENNTYNAVEYDKEELHSKEQEEIVQEEKKVNQILKL